MRRRVRSGRRRRATSPTPAHRLALLAAALLPALGSCADPGRDRPADDPARMAVGTPIGRFVGSEACRDCHEEIFSAWASSRHHLTLRTASSDAPPRLAGLELEPGYAVGADLAVTGRGQDGEEMSATAAYLIGGRHREDLLARMDDGRLQVFPFAFDVDSEKPFEHLRRLSGGFSPPPDSVDFWTRIGRNADLNCYGCHATGARVTAEAGDPSEARAPRSLWSEAGVGCEACHGPAGRHVDDAASSDTPVAPPWTGEDLDPEQRVGMCASCHGLRETLASPFRSEPAHVHGQPVWQFAKPLLRKSQDFEFRAPLFVDLRPNVYQQEAVALGQSACVRLGGLTCAHCHDVHSGELEPRVEQGRACLPCHQEVADRGMEHSRHPADSAGGGCLDCHMSEIVRGPGSLPSRDHTLAPPTAGEGEVPAACVACHREVEDPSAIVEAWRAWPRESAESRRRSTIAGAIGKLEQGEADAGAAMAGLIADPAQGWFVRMAAARTLSAPAGPPWHPSVAPVLEEALGDPNPAVRAAAAAALGRFGRTETPTILGRAADGSDPDLALEAVTSLALLGVDEHAARLVELTRDPDLVGGYRVHLALGRAALTSGQWEAAERALRTALDLHPINVTALNELGLALEGQGKVSEARRCWERVLELNPRFQAARRNLEESAGQAPDEAPDPRREGPPGMPETSD